MNLLTEMSDMRARKALATPKTLRAGLSCIGFKTSMRRQKIAAASWEISFKFVSNALSWGMQNANISRIFSELESGLNSAKSISKALNSKRLGCFCFDAFQWAISAVPKPIVVNPMLTESA